MKKIVHIALIVLTVALLFMPLIQNYTGWIKMRPLAGESIKTNKPVLTFNNVKGAAYQHELEQYLTENYGFKEPLTRFYNQYLWDFYRKTYSKEVAIGKNDWLYFNFNVDEYYGKEMYRWVESTEKAVERFTKQLRILNKLKGVLNSYGIDFLIFTSPDKANIYSQFLPERSFDTTTIHAYDFYRKAFEESGFPYIDMNSWFLTMQDSLDYPAIPQTSAHWVFPAVYAADSLFRFMAEMKGITMPQISIGERQPNSELTLGTIRDLEQLLNLSRKISIDENLYYERKVDVVEDTNALKTNAIFIGNSYFFAINQYIELNKIFSDARYWFYNMTEYYGDRLQHQRPIDEVDRLSAIINADYIVWFTDNAQMYKISYGFAEDALFRLCVSDSLWNDQVAKMMNTRGISQAEAEQVLWDDIELIDGLGGDETPSIRNTKGIAEARMEYKVQTVAENWRRDPEMMEIVTKQATENNMDIEEQLLIDARWFVNTHDNEE